MSLFVWAALLSVTLCALAVGYYAGGVLIDRAPRASRLGWVLLISGIVFALVPVLASAVLRVVILSISGHQHAKMQARYTSFWGPRQLEAFDSIMGLVTGKQRRAFVATPDPALITEGSAVPSEAA